MACRLRTVVVDDESWRERSCFLLERAGGVENSQGRVNGARTEIVGRPARSLRSTSDAGDQRVQVANRLMDASPLPNLVRDRVRSVRARRFTVNAATTAEAGRCDARRDARAGAGRSRGSARERGSRGDEPSGCCARWATARSRRGGSAGFRRASGHDSDGRRDRPRVGVDESSSS